MSNEFMERKEDEMLMDVLDMTVSDLLTELKDSDLGPLFDSMIDQVVKDRIDYMVYQEAG
jgi:hypothetical protein